MQVVIRFRRGAVELEGTDERAGKRRVGWLGSPY
jgi:hypothetical protein